MAPPVPTTRVTPTGRKIGRGGPTYVTFHSKPGLNIWEQTVKPPGFKLDDRKDTTTSYNDRIRTFSPGRLMTGQDITINCGYDPDDYMEIIDLLGVRDTITVTLPSGTKYAFYGWLDAVDPNDHNEQDDPMLTLTLAQGNQDWDTCEEEMPVVVPGTGTAAIC